MTSSIATKWVRKPNPAIYQLALARLGAEAGQTTFPDDALTNVLAAERVGIPGVLVDANPTEAIAATRRLAGLIIRSADGVAAAARQCTVPTPARSNVARAAASVAPVVTTSSTSSTRS